MLWFSNCNGHMCLDPRQKVEKVHFYVLAYQKWDFQLETGSNPEKMSSKSARTKQKLWKGANLIVYTCLDARISTFSIKSTGLNA